MGNLTHTTYANQRMTLDRKSAKFQEQSGYDDRATWVIHVACFHHSCFVRAFADASIRRGDLRTRHSYFLRKFEWLIDVRGNTGLPTNAEKKV